MMGIYVPYFPNWLRARGLTGLEWSLVSAVLPFSSMLAPPLFGMIADAFGLRGSLLRWAAFGAALSFAAITVFVSLDGNLSFPLLLTLVCSFALFRTPMHLIADVLALETTVAYGRIRLWGSMGFLLAAPMVGWWLPLETPVMLPLAITLAVVAAWGVSHGLPKNGTIPERAVWALVRDALRSSECRRLLAAAVFGQAAHAAYNLCISIYLADRGASAGFIGLWWSLGTASEVVLMAISPWLLSRFRAELLLLIALVVGAARWMLLASYVDLWWLFASQPLHAVTFGLRWVSCVRIVQRMSDQGNIATLQGLYVGANAVGGGLGMLVWGSSYEVYGGQRVYSWAAVVSLLAAAIVLPWLGKSRDSARLQ